MKKLLSIITVLGLVASTSTTTISCGNTETNEVVKKNFTPLTDKKLIGTYWNKYNGKTMKELMDIVTKLDSKEEEILSKYDVKPFQLTDPTQSTFKQMIQNILDSIEEPNLDELTEDLVKAVLTRVEYQIISFGIPNIWKNVNSQIDAMTSEMGEWTLETPTDATNICIKITEITILWLQNSINI